MKLVAVITLLALSAGVACTGQESSPDGPATRARPAPAVDVATAEARAVESVVTAVGATEAHERVWVSAEIDGTVEDIQFLEGERVAFDADPGAPLLFRLDDDLARLEVANARARLAAASVDLEASEAAFARKQALRERGATTEAVHTDARLAVERGKALRAEAQARLALAEERLERTRILAPAPGVLGRRLVSPGEYVRAGDPLVELVTIDPIEVVFRVPERYRTALASGLTADISSDAFPDEVFSAEVFFVAPVVDPGTRSIELQARIPNPDRRLLPGLFIRVRLVLSVREATTIVPEAAIVPRGGALYVYVVEEGRAVRRLVEIGERLPGEVEILEGVQAGDQVIVAGQQSVSDGAPVRPRAG